MTLPTEQTANASPIPPGGTPVPAGTQKARLSFHHPHPPHHTEAGREGGREGGRNRTHGADGVKEHLTKVRLTGGADGPGRPPPASRSYKIHTTLGNGYLGSRIDEERSEMRYLV